MRAAVHRESGSLEFFSSFVGAEERLRKEAFFLAYHLHWGYVEIAEMPTDERWAFVRLLVDQLERERESLDQARRR